MFEASRNKCDLNDLGVKVMLT